MTLTSIVIPCMARDVEAFDRLLAIWSDHRLSPVLKDDLAPAIPLVVVLNKDLGDTASEFRAVFAKHPGLNVAFSGLTILDAKLEGDKDLYVRGEIESRGRFGNKAGPNFLFFNTIEMLRDLHGFTFQCEVDCYPIVPGWLSHLRFLISERKYAWVIGSFYTGVHPVAKSIQFHFNGNAVYHTGSRQFQTFVENVWKPGVLDMVDTDPNLAYDCWWSIVKHSASSAVSNTAWTRALTYDQFFCNSQFLINTLRADTALEDTSYSLRVARDTEQKCLFLHGHAATSIIKSFLQSDIVEFSIFVAEAIKVQEEARHKTEEESSPSASAIYAQADQEEEPFVLPNKGAKLLDPENLYEPIRVPKLPFEASPSKIPTACFIGSWYPIGASDHIWVGKGTAAFQLTFDTPQSSLDLLLRGRLATGLDPASVSIRAFGANNVAVSWISDDQVLLRVQDAAPVKSIVVMIVVSEAMRVGSDMRELGFVLFGLEVSSLEH